MKTTSNYHWRNFSYREDVPAEVLANELDWADAETCWDNFLCYQGTWYHLSQFERTHGSYMSIGGVMPGDEQTVDGWHGFHGYSATAGVLIRLSDDCEQYQIASYRA